jgi:cytoskeletal protein RodZ
LEDLELGTLLKKARQNKGLTIDQIQEETKIRKKYLLAMEENNFDVLPGTVYLKVFVKGYARLVDLNYQALLDNYPVLHQEDKKIDRTPEQEYLSSTNLKRGPAKYKTYKNIFKWIVLVFFAFVLILGGVFAYQYFTNAELRLLNQPQVEENINDTAENQPENSVSISELDNNQEEITEDNTVQPEENLETESNNINNLNENQIPAADNDLQNEESLEQSNLSDEASDSNIETENTSENNLDNNLSSETSSTSEVIQDNSAENANTDEEADLSEEANNAEQDTIIENNNSTADDAVLEVEEETTENNLQTAEIIINNNERVWLNVIADGDNVFSSILEIEETLNYEIEERLYLKIGLADAVTVNVNGEEYGPFSGTAGIAEVEFLLEDGEVIFNNLRD